MRKLLLLCLIFLLFAGAVPAASGEERRTADDLRARYLENLNKKISAVYVNGPSSANPYEAGVLTDEAIEAAVSEANFIRWLAGLDELETDAGLNALAQHGAVLMAANKSLSHSPEQPADMPDDFFKMGEAAAASCNLAMFNWAEEDLLNQAVVQFSRDDTGANRYILGHRRWLLYPAMKYTGFGLAQDEDGRSYAAMYVMDESNGKAEYDLICWPSGGAFPAELMSADTPWSVTPNPEIYDLERTSPRIVMTEETTGAEFVFEIMTEEAAGDQYFVLGGGRFGGGPTYIFRPDLSAYDRLMYGYSQNQVWTVRLDGMILKNGAPAGPIEYTVEIASLTPISPAAVEIMPREMTVRIGEEAYLSAQVIPDWADDLSVVWSSSDESIASVGPDGRVRGIGKGTCLVIAEAVNGKKDEVGITVTE